MALPAIAAGALRIGSMFVRGSSTFVKGASRGVGRSGGMLRRAILKKTKVKRKNIVSRKVFNKRIKEKRRRMSKEQALETFKTRGKSGAPNVPGKSFLQRILDFIGILLVGWLVDKLPKIIKWVQNLIERIRKLVDSLKSFIKNLGDWFKSIGSIVSAGWDNIRNFDFTDQSGKLEKAMTDMENAFKGMQTDIEGMKNALTGDMSGETSGGADASAGAASIDDPNARALLNAIAEAEGTSGYPNQGYNTQFTGTQFTDLSKHPEQLRSGGGYTSDAAGRYQFLSTTWKGVMGGAMTPERQDKAALKLVAGRGVDIKNGLSINEIYKLGGEWASIEGGPNMKKGGSYGGQAKYNAENFLQMYQKYGGKVEGQEGGSGGRYGGGGGNVVEYYTGDRGHPNFEYRGHGRESNYHDHIAFRTIQDKERAKAALRAAGIQIGSEFRSGDPGWHGKDLAIDVPGAQWGGSGAIGQREYNGSAKVRQVLINAGFGGSGLGFGTRGTSTSIARSTGKMPDIGYSTGPKNTIIIVEEEAPTVMMGGGSRGSSPVIVMGSSLNSIMKRKLLTDLAYT